LQRRCPKWACITHLNIWNTSYVQKKGWESNWQFDSWPLKVGNRPDLFACRWRATYHWKALNKSYNFTLDFISIRGMHAKLWRPKVVRVLTLAISGLPLGSLGTKSHLDVGPMGSHKIYYKGEGGGFPQVRAVVNLVCPSCPWFVLAPKMFKLCTNHLVLVLCKSVWINEACQFFLSIPKGPARPSTLPKCYELGNVSDSLFFHCFLFGIHIWIPQGVRSTSYLLRLPRLSGDIYERLIGWKII
jgi:hypothetical protein